MPAALPKTPTLKEAHLDLVFNHVSVTGDSCNQLQLALLE